jgi:ribosomal protein S18 acetylase RimI-like enzyme
MNLKDLKFEPINLQKDSAICVKFRADSFSASFGHDRDFWGEDGQGDMRYLEWLKKKLSLSPQMAFHLWSRAEIIGQVELDFYKGDKEVGYVNLYYLSPSYRGCGVSTCLDQFVVNFFVSLGLRKILLSVSPDNTRAIAFYKKHGWNDLGPRFSDEELERNRIPQVHLMEKSI